MVAVGLSVPRPFATADELKVANTVYALVSDLASQGYLNDAYEVLGLGGCMLDRGGDNGRRRTRSESVRQG